MAVIVVVDLNGQKVQHAFALAQSLDLSDVKKVMMFGSEGYLHSWSQRLSKHYNRAQEIEYVPTDARRDETTILMSSTITQHALASPASADDQWIIVSQRAGFKTLTEQMKSWGIKDVRWAPAPTFDLFRSLLCAGEKEIGPSIYEIAQKIMINKGRQPVLVGTMANIITDMLPELKDPDYREALFGSRKFKQIFDSVGLKVKGQHLHPLSEK